MIHLGDFLNRVTLIHSDGHYFTKTHARYDKYLEDAFTCISKISSVTKKFDWAITKFQLERETFDEAAFLEDVCEITIASHYASIYNTEFVYERKISGETNADFSFKANEITFNVEVKCPSPIRLDPDTKEIFFNDRMENRGVLVGAIKAILADHGQDAGERKREDLKLKDCLVSAQKKFADADSTEVNVLVVCCDNELHMQEYRNYLVEKDGFLTSSPIIPHEDFSAVDYIMLTNLLHRHHEFYSDKKSGISSPWSIEDSFRLLFKNPFSKHKKNTATISDVFTNYTHEFEKYFADRLDIPNGESFNTKVNLGIAWFCDKFRENDRHFFQK
jgi:hypothetical protein